MINLTKEHNILSIQKIRAIKSACLKSAQNRSEKRAINIQEAKNLGIKDTNQQLSKRDLLFLGIGLYWGEGYKNGNGEFGFTNSDPGMIKTYLKVLREIYNIEKEQLTLKININELFIDKINDIEKYWQDITQIGKEQFTKTTVIKSKLNKKYNIDGYKGTIRIKVKKGESLKTRVLESVKEIQNIARI